MERKQKYCTPEIEVSQFATEVGFATSNSLPGANWDSGDSLWSSSIGTSWD